MSHGIPGWTADLERSFKEVLFRFLEEVQSTKAALYLLTPDGGFALVTQYGFGRRDELVAEHHVSDALPRLAREQRSTPRAFNHPEELPDLERYLSGAGNARMLLVPISARSGIVGFVDARDKGRKKPFASEDVAVARRIADALLRLVEETGLVPEIETSGVEAERPPLAVDAGSTPARRTSPALDEAGLAEVHAAAHHIVRRGVATAAALSVMTPRNGAMLLLEASAGEPVDVEAVQRHQREALRHSGSSLVSPTSWRVDSRRIDERAAARVAQQITSSALLSRDDWALVASLVGPMGAREPEESLGRLRATAESAAEMTDLRSLRRRTVWRMIHVSDAYPDLAKHSTAVSRLCFDLAIALGLGRHQREEVALAGLLHDVGMQQIDYQRLYRHAAPGPEERRHYQRHVLEGERMAIEAGLDGLAPVLRHHHERWDGTGYPDRLAKETIPRLARIVHVAEVYDVLTSPHSYRPAVSRERALSVMESAAGRQFDPQLVRALTGIVR